MKSICQKAHQAFTICQRCWPRCHDFEALPADRSSSDSSEDAPVGYYRAHLADGTFNFEQKTCAEWSYCDYDRTGVLCICGETEPCQFPIQCMDSPGECPVCDVSCPPSSPLPSLREEPERQRDSKTKKNWKKKLRKKVKRRSPEFQWNL